MPIASSSEKVTAGVSYQRARCRRGGIPSDQFWIEPLPESRFEAIRAAAHGCPDLSNNNRAVLHAIMEAAHNGRCPPLKEIADAAGGVDIATVQRSLARLQFFGFLEITRRWWADRPPAGWNGPVRRSQETNGYRPKLPTEAAIWVEAETGTLPIPPPAAGKAEYCDVQNAQPESPYKENYFPGLVEAVENANMERKSPKETEFILMSESQGTCMIQHLRAFDDREPESTINVRPPKQRRFQHPTIIITIGAKVEAMRGLRWTEACKLIRCQAKRTYPNARFWVTVGRDGGDTVDVAVDGPDMSSRQQLRQTWLHIIQADKVNRWLRNRIY